ncbi:Plug domain-containing protein [Altererythrobacter sp. BO-6]|uniref:TonB-dependent receptor plug domain-containing protein n=1 Tax=Altererythrobacter sp. BO-6 TaxID=2604537 RepID=UPI0019D09486|nr:Plug domain-containing protein [Altererythrobacter sp. BO-6]
MKLTQTNPTLRAMLLGSTIIAAAQAAPAFAQSNAGASDASDDNVIIVTATRRAESVQDIPLNIAAVGSEQIEEQGLTELSDLLPFVPGINIVDRGGRQGNPIIVRGLNVDAIGSGDGNNNGGGTVATYLGEIPVFVDLKLNDLERVEVLLGPQGDAVRRRHAWRRHSLHPSQAPVRRNERPGARGRFEVLEGLKPQP